MQKKRIIIVGIVLIAIIAAVTAFFLLQPKDELPAQVVKELGLIEQAFASQGFKTTTPYYPLFETVDVEVHYEYDHCINIINKVISKFGPIQNIETNKRTTDDDFVEDTSGAQLPTIIVKGRAEIVDSRKKVLRTQNSYEYIITGLAACSESVLESKLCSVMEFPPSFCANVSDRKRVVTLESLDAGDALCYEACLADVVVAGEIITQYRRGPPCAPKPGFVSGQNRVLPKLCQLGGCISDENDKACCLATQCVHDGICYDSLEVVDTDSDGNSEICTVIGSFGMWVDADGSDQLCKAIHFEWVTCSDKECGHGTDSFDSKENGFCCGDDANEQATKCAGTLCKTQSNRDIVCCEPESCSYNGHCYEPGCAELTLSTDETIQAYCNEGAWVDLDEEFCPFCLGDDAWSGLICCGDDFEEGKYATRFVYHDDNTTNIVFEDFCTNDKDSCITPESESEFPEGCYTFEDNAYLTDGYYCKKSEWYDLDNSSKFCEQCGFDWTGDCCGDDKNEHLIEGIDGTTACCLLETDKVIDGRCVSTLNCGNGNLDSGEQCELPYSNNNENCKQTGERCFGNRLGTRDRFGSCDQTCSCEEDTFEIACRADFCGAECGTDSDCGPEEVCDLATCGCREKTYCGDGEVQEKNDDDWSEQCELPSSIFNSHCDETTQCFDTQTGVRYELGACDDNCQCRYTPFQKMCIKGSCGASCNQDGSGCPEGSTCSTDTCTCVSSSAACGNEICELGEQYTCIFDCISLGCPARIDIEFEKKRYITDETFVFDVTVFDKNNNELPDMGFDIDVVVNGKYLRTSTHQTNDKGTFRQSRVIQDSLTGGTYEYVAYIAKSLQTHCDYISDSDRAVFLTDGSAQLSEINLSRFELVYLQLNQTTSVCGNGEIERGEACEGQNICRLSIGCDYETRSYDIAESCSTCSCPVDRKSVPDGDVYCNNCDAHCGDGVVNCGEECEAESEQGEIGQFCREGSLYHRIDSCNSCTWVDDGVENDILITDCFCECQKSPGQCDGGNWIEYPKSHFAGCTGTACNACACDDVYTKDSNNDGWEDKCSPEICTNGKDDNDNGLIDLEDPECSLCQYCGHGTFNLCDQNECDSFAQTCNFKEGILGYGSCCSDKDEDGICDTKDNCPEVSNIQQEDTDEDGVGDVCDLCMYEPLLFEPTSANETMCADGIDNDCDGELDCQDPDCIGVANCCRKASDCLQGQCTIETCNNNQCVTVPRSLCDNSECVLGEFCNRNGTCSVPDDSSEVCTSCVQDKTVDDHGINYNISYDQIEGGACCGDKEREFLLQQIGTGATACCNQITDCVTENATCVPSGIYQTPHQNHCLTNTWYQCDENVHVNCAEAGPGYKESADYTRTGLTNWICTNDGDGWLFRQTIPEEICGDRIDNDCDGLIDQKDADC